MATRSRTTFQKRQKEMKRQEKQRMKAARREEKRLAKREDKDFAGSGPEIATADDVFELRVSPGQPQAGESEPAADSEPEP